MPSVNPVINTNESSVNTLIDTTIAGHCIDGYTLTLRQSGFFYFLIYKLAKNDGFDIRLTHNNLATLLSCTTRNITKIVTRLEDLELITVNRETTITNGAPRTVNTYNINWKKAYALLGNKIYGAKAEWKHTFIFIQLEKIKRQATEVFTRMFKRCRNLVPPLYSYNINNNIYMRENEKEEVPMPDNGKCGDPPTVAICTFFPENMETCSAEWMKVAEDVGMNTRYIEKEFQYVRSYWLGLGNAPFAQKADWKEVWTAWLKRAKTNEKNAYKFMPDLKPAPLPRLSTLYCWNVNFDMPDDWRAYMDAHGGFTNMFAKTFEAFGRFYSTRTQIIRNDSEWFTLWKRWIDSRPRQVEESKPALTIQTTEGTIQHDIRTLIGDGPYHAYFKEAKITPIQNDEKYHYALTFPPKYAFVKARFQTELLNLKIYIT